MKSNLAASKQQATIDCEEREKVMSFFDLCYLISNMVYQDINILKSQLAASKQQAMVDRKESEKVIPFYYYFYFKT